MNKNVNESSITRLLRHNEEHDCVCITAYRSNREKDDLGVHKRKARVSNQKANSALCAVLRQYGYNVTKVVGKYPEENGQSDVKENSWFVVNVNDDSDFVDVCADLAESDEQDSILVMPKGCFASGKGCYLYGTNPSGSWPKYHEKKMTDGISVNGDSPFETRIAGKRYSFNVVDESSEDTFWNPTSMFGAMARHAYIKNHYGLNFFDVRGVNESKQFVETIDGSIKDIVQLKTLDSSLEYSQMFDALEDCPKDFQAKLIQALNSVGETIQVSPVDVFNIVLCASNDGDDKDVTKKMYNWWKAVFEILSRCDIPDDRKAEYDDLVDTLMAEVSKDGDAVQVNEAEEYGYEQANIEDEEVMLKDMEFAISKIGEIANRVQDLINFVNPYCQLVKESSGEFYLEDVREDYLLGRITDEEMEDAINGIEDIYEDMKPKFISSLKELKDEFMGYVDAANSGSSSALTLLGGLVSRLKITTVFGFDKWWDKCPLNKHNEFNEDNMMKFKKIDESGKRFGCRTSALTNHRTNEIKKMYVSGRISEDEAFEQLSEIGRDDSTAEMLIDRWNSDYGINESNENELSNEMVEVTYYLPEDYKDDPDDDSWITTKETLGEICGEWFDGKYNMDKKEGEFVYRVSGPDGYNYFKFDNPEDEEKFLEYAEMLRGGTVDESHKMNESNGEFVPPELFECDGVEYKIEPEKNPTFPEGDYAILEWEDGEYKYKCRHMGAYDVKLWMNNMRKDENRRREERILRQRYKMNESKDGEWVDMDDLIGVPQTDPEDDASLKTEGFSDFNDDGEDPIISYEDEDGNHSVMVVTGHDEMGEMVYQVKVDEEEWTTTSNLEEAKMEAEKLVGKINKRPDADYQLMPVDEAKVVQDVTDVWALLKVLEDDKASKNLKDLIDSHVRSEEEIMDAVDELYPEDVTQTELNNVFASGMEDIVDALGLDVNAYVKDGSFVDLEAPSTIAAEGDEEAKPEEVNGDEKKFKGDDGEVKTLDNANKKVVSEMTIEQDINSAEDLERILWGQGKENFNELVSKYGADEVMSVLEESGITNLTQMNDYLWFEIDSIEEMLGGTTDDDGAEEL